MHPKQVNGPTGEAAAGLPLARSPLQHKAPRLIDDTDRVPHDGGGAQEEPLNGNPVTYRVHSCNGHPPSRSAEPSSDGGYADRNCRNH